MSPGKLWTGRPMHQTTLSLGDDTPCYTTIHTESFCGKRDDGQPLVFYLRDPHYPSQHRSRVDLRNVSEDTWLTSTHSRDIHGPKSVTPHYVLRGLRTRNWIRNCEGLAMKEVTNPAIDTPYRTSYHTDHCGDGTMGLTEQASGRPTDWHRHDVITGN